MPPRPFVRTGLPPWMPDPEAQDLHVLHGYDCPMVAVYRVGDEWFASAYLAGEPAILSMWNYVGLTEDEHDALLGAEFDDVDTLMASILHLTTTGRWVAYAAARNGRVELHDEAPSTMDKVEALRAFGEAVFTTWGQPAPATEEVQELVDSY